MFRFLGIYFGCSKHLSIRKIEEKNDKTNSILNEWKTQILSLFDEVHVVKSLAIS